jgi:hypothetical protein
VRHDETNIVTYPSRQVLLAVSVLALAASIRRLCSLVLALGATRSHAPTLLGVRLVQPGGRSMDASASDVAAVLLGALEGKDATAARRARGQRCHGGAAQPRRQGSSKLARRGVSLAMMLRDAGGGGGYGAGHDPCGFKGVRPRERDGELERAAGGAGARPRVSTSAADLFVAGTSVASKARAAGSLLRNLRLPGGGQEDGE